MLDSEHKTQLCLRAMELTTEMIDVVTYSIKMGIQRAINFRCFKEIKEQNGQYIVDGPKLLAETMDFNAFYELMRGFKNSFVSQFARFLQGTPQIGFYHADTQDHGDYWRIQVAVSPYVVIDVLSAFNRPTTSEVMVSWNGVHVIITLLVKKNN